jgi:hypothetical protein
MLNTGGTHDQTQEFAARAEGLCGAGAHGIGIGSTGIKGDRE